MRELINYNINEQVRNGTSQRRPSGSIYNGENLFLKILVFSDEFFLKLRLSYTKSSHSAKNIVCILCNDLYCLKNWLDQFFGVRSTKEMVSKVSMKGDIMEKFSQRLETDSEFFFYLFVASSPPNLIYVWTVRHQQPQKNKTPCNSGAFLRKKPQLKMDSINWWWDWTIQNSNSQLIDERWETSLYSGFFRGCLNEWASKMTLLDGSFWSYWIAKNVVMVEISFIKKITKIDCLLHWWLRYICNTNF